MKIKNLAIAVTFHYVEDRIQYLEKIATQFALLADQISVHIFTNIDDSDKKLRIADAINPESKYAIEIHSPTYLGHPYLLAWSHFFIFRKIFDTDESVTHFLYVEDDIFIAQKNIEYWLKSREELRAYGLVPSFIRYEKLDGASEFYAPDASRASNFDDLPRILTSDNYCYLNLPEPYQGMYLLDRELMYEHLTGPSSIPEKTPWDIREKAAAGLTFTNVPKGCYSRNFLGYDLKNKRIDPDSLIHHLPNNYVDKEGTILGKIKMSELIIYD